MGRKQCPRFSFAAPLLPGGCLTLLEGRSERWWDLHKTPAGPGAKPGHFIPALKPHTQGLQAGVEPRKKNSPSEVCLGCLVPAKTGCLSQILGEPERVELHQLLAQNEWELPG